MLVLAVSIVVLSAVFFIVSEQIITIGIQKENAEAKKTVADLATAARDVYTQGEDATKTLTIILPSTYSPESSGIMNDSVVIKTRETYHVENLEFPAYGTLPQAAGAHEVTIMSRGNSVYFGNSLFRMSPSLVSTTIIPNSNVTKYVKITNVANESITVHGFVNWQHSAIALSVSSSDLEFVLAPYGERTIPLFFSASNIAGGYSGSIRFNANSSLLNDTQNLALYAEIGVMISIPSNMTVYPLEWSAVLGPGQNLTQTFIICTNGPQALTNVTFTPSSGGPGSWLSNLDPIPRISVSECVSKNITIVVPQLTTTGIYNGTLNVSAVTPTNNFSIGVTISMSVLPPRMTVSPVSWNATLGPGAYSTEDFIICTENLYLSTVTFTTAGSTASWITGITPIGPINSGTCAVKTLTVTVPVSASPGTYYGSINVSGDLAYSQLINNTVKVIAQNMSVSPTSWNVSLKLGGNTSETFMVCAINISINNVSYIPSGGEPGSWVFNTSSSGPLQPNSCLLKKLLLSIPENASTGNYYGNITFSGDAMYNVSVPLGVYAKPPYNNITIQNVVHSPKPAYSSTPSISIRAFANGSANSNKNITSCWLTLDNELIYPMSAVDGAYDSPSENITVVLGQLSRGIHEAVIACYDSDEIPSRNSVYSFRVYKEILFVYYGTTPTASENDWVNWITANSKNSSNTSQTVFISSQAVNISAGAINNYTATFALGGASWIINETDITEPAFDFFFNFTNISTNASKFAVNMYGKYQGSVGHGVYFYLWNYFSSAWVNLGRLDASNTLRWYNFSNLPASSYVQGSRAVARITHTSSGNAQHYMLLDYVELYANTSQTYTYRWFMDSAYASNITSGAVDESFYKIMVFGDWGNNPPALLGAKADVFLAKNRSMLFLGNALVYAPADFGASGSTGGTASDYRMKVLSSTHDITTGFAQGSIISVSSATGQTLARFSAAAEVNPLGEIGANPAGRIILAQMNKTFYWGVLNASILNANGTAISARTIDYALNQSQIME